MNKRIALLLVFLTPSAAGAQVPRPVQHSRAEIIAAARDVMQQARFCTFVTIGEDGHPQARIVDPLAPDAGFTIWIATNPLTRKVKEVRRDARVTLLCFDTATSSYVTVLGRGALVTDVAEKQAHWKSDWARIYPSGARGGDSVLIHVTPTRLEIVSDSRGMVGDPKTWLPLAIGFPQAVQDKPDFSGRWILANAEPPGPDIPKAMTVRQSLVRTNVRGEPMTPFYKDIAIDRDFESGTRSETHAIGVTGGVVPGRREDGGPNGPRGLHAVKWDRSALVFEGGAYTGEIPETGVWAERREVWSLHPDGRLRVAITTRNSVDGAKTVTMMYRRP